MSRFQDTFMYGVQDLVGFIMTTDKASPNVSSSSGVLEIWSFSHSHFQHRKVISLALIRSGIHSFTGPQAPDDQLFAIPFAKSAATGQHAPVGGRHGIWEAS